MSKILIIPPKTITAAEKKEAAKAGFAVIEIDDPSKVIVVDESQIISGSDLSYIALSTINNASPSDQAVFTRKLFEYFKLKRHEAGKS
jgi:hypothetical protein